MSELERIFLTSALTVAGGVFVLALGQLVVRFVVEPLHEQAKAIGEVVYVLIFYADLYANPGGVITPAHQAAVDALRKSASQLMATSHGVRAYWLWACLRMAPPFGHMLEATRSLIFLSNSVYRGDRAENRTARTRSIKSLRLRLLERLDTP